MSIIEVQFKSIKNSPYFSRIPSVPFMGFIVLEGPAILGEFHLRGVDCLQMLRDETTEKKFLEVHKKVLKSRNKELSDLRTWNLIKSKSGLMKCLRKWILDPQLENLYNITLGK